MYKKDDFSHTALHEAAVDDHSEKKIRKASSRQKC